MPSTRSTGEATLEMISLEIRKCVLSRQRRRPYHRILFAPVAIAAAADMLAGSGP
jgi:hypothetical protein